MNRLRALLLVFVVSSIAAGGSLLVAALVGMNRSDIFHLAAMLGPAVLATVVSAAVARPLLSSAPVRHRLLALALVAVAVSLANLAVLAALMMLQHETLIVAVLVFYSAGAGAGAAWSLARSFSVSIERISETARKLADGDLSARVGTVGGGPELERLAASLDAMASRLEISIQSEKSAIRIRDDLITAVSHDLKTPLSGLRAMVESISDGVVDDPQTLRRYIAEMRRSVESLVVLVDDLFELVKLDARAVEQESRRTTLSDVIAAALAACEAQARDKGLSLETKYDGAEDRLCSPRLARVVQNLVQNAIRHTPSDGSVRILARRLPGSLEVVVEDSGEGIPDAALEKIFDPFWRGDAARTTAGSGLGLALSKRIVEALGGEIRVQRGSPVGSRFAVLIPDAR
jgi:signal transduction histidine kinase